MLREICAIVHGTYLCIFTAILIHSTKAKKSPDGFYTHVFFATTIILISGGLFLHHLSWIYRVKFKFMKAPIYEFSKEKCGTRTKQPKAEIPIWKARKKPPKGHTKISNFSTAQSLIFFLNTFLQLM